MVFCTYYIGRAFGGTGTLGGALRMVIWWQGFLAILQALQLVLVIASPLLAGLVGLVGGLYSLWVYVCFVSVLHGFASRGQVFLGILASLFGVAFGLILLSSILAAFLGLEVQNA